MSDKQTFNESEKLEKLYNIYVFAYDKFCKYSNKKENNFQLI